jgi:hypothetical protein
VEQILGVLGRADDPGDVHLELAPVGIGQLPKRRPIAGARTSEGRLGHARILAPTLPLIRIAGKDVGATRKSSRNLDRVGRLN